MGRLRGQVLYHKRERAQESRRHYCARINTQAAQKWTIFTAGWEAKEGHGLGCRKWMVGASAAKLIRGLGRGGTIHKERQYYNHRQTHGWNRSAGALMPY